MPKSETLEMSGDSWVTVKQPYPDVFKGPVPHQPGVWLFLVGEPGVEDHFALKVGPQPWWRTWLYRALGFRLFVVK